MRIPDLSRVRLIASDLDGTLLLNGAQSLRPETCGLIEALMDRGVIFVAASGRQLANLRRLFAPVADRIGYLCENGGSSYYQNKKIHQELMDEALAGEIIDAAMRMDDLQIAISGQQYSYILPGQPDFLDYMRNTIHFDAAETPDLKHPPEPILKVSMHAPGGDWHEDYWQQRFGDRCKVVASGNNWVDLMPPQVNKAFGLNQLIARLGVSPRQVLAIGDNDNDREMLLSMGIPVSMDSAKPEIRALADFCTDTVEHLFKELLG